MHSFERPEPRIERSDDVLIRMKEVGLDGTDFNMVKNRLQDIADERDEIVLGHEGVGVVEAVGNGVTSVAPGDKVVLTVRRGCGRCEPCRHDESDMCMTGLYNERGLHKLDGFRGLLGEMVTFRVSFQDCEKAFTNDDPNQIKTVVEMDPW